MSKPTLKLDWCSHAAAKYAVETWHYSKTMPMPPMVRVGVWEDGDFIGCVVFSRGASPGLLNPYGLKQTEGAELTRIALTQHKSPVSRIVAVSIRLLCSVAPGLRLLVSFADPAQGHVGCVYQAGGWVYCGASNPELQFYDGRRWIHRREAVGKTSFGKSVTGYNWKTMRSRMTPGKHRYLMPLDAEMRARILPLSKPYPKRAVSTVVSAPGNQPGEGGPNPTTALLP